MTARISAEKLDELEKILKEQIRLIDKNDHRAIYNEIANCGKLIDELRLESLSGDNNFDDRRREVMELYRRLILVLDTGKKKVTDQLNRLRKNKKTLVLYKDGPGSLVR
ncbi:MAG: hypothetical protein KAS23_10550 [Anaerohalosphaera sp.]|nr:hypothetical protein [Anaerohalosphaera sp.]